MKRIPFSATSVRAIQNTVVGSWPPEPIDANLPVKGMTRRVIVPQPLHEIVERYKSNGDPQSLSSYCTWRGENLADMGEEAFVKKACLYPPGIYAVGEALRRWPDDGTGPEWAVYDADNMLVACDRPDTENCLPWRWKRNYLRNIVMPLEAARLFLEVLESRPERLHKILHGDAVLEGAPPGANHPRIWFMVTWDELNAKRDYPYCDNPWVFVSRFKRISAEDAEASR